MSDVSIDYTSNFEVRCPPWYLDKCRAIPSRRWMKRGKFWSCPALGRNVVYLREAFPGATWSAAAKAKADDITAVKNFHRPGMPAGYKFKREPLSQQREALDRAYNMNVFGFIMDPGTCKSQIFVDWTACYAMEGRIEGALIICPNSVTFGWIDELAISCPIEYEALVMDTGSYRKTEKFLASDKRTMRYLIVSWEALSQGKAIEYCKRFLARWKCAVGEDESSWGKNHKSTRTKAGWDLRDMCHYRAIMTGTPVLSKIHDLFAQFEFLDPAIIDIGDYYSFCQRYVVYGGYEGKEIVGYTKVDELMDLIKPYVYVKEKRECLNLPPRFPPNSPPGVIRNVKMVPHQRKLYKEIKSKKGLPEWEGKAVSIQMSLEKFLRLQQVIQGIVSVDTGEKDKHGKRILQQHRIFDKPEQNPKLAEALNLIEEISGQIVIYSPFVYNVEDMTALLKKVYPKDRVLTLPKGEPELLREKCKEFYRGDYRFIVTSQRQGGIGLNGLQSAGDTIYLANTQNLENRVQSEGRTERQGSLAAKITFWDIIMEDSEDTKSIMPSLREKMDLSEFVRKKLKQGYTLEDFF